ncbi:MAG TPA: hypothetical protein ENJ62_04140, partial [Bryobacterales bacterium]|nr:hypothetical protein [Bryobacterales bacterium]
MIIDRPVGLTPAAVPATGLGSAAAGLPPALSQPMTAAQPVTLAPPVLAVQPPVIAGSVAAPAPALSAPPATLMGLTYVPLEAAAKTLTIRAPDATASIVLDARAGANVKNFLGTLRATDSIDLITGFIWTPTQMVAYLPHMYFFVIPMAMGDCLAGMGNLQEAEEQYLSVLA